MTVVVLFRSPTPKPKEDEYHKVLRENGMKPFSIPVLSFQFDNQQQLVQKLREPYHFRGMVLTSQRAVEAMERCVNDLISREVWKNTLRNDWQDKAIFVVGQATAKAALDKLGLESTGHEAGSAEALVPVILHSVRQGHDPLLFPCGNLRRETIPTEMEKAGIPLDSVQVYRTCADLNIEQSLEDLIKEKGVPSYAVFFSPSGVNFTAEIVSSFTKWWSKVELVAIGKTTEQAMKNKQWTVTAVADQPNTQALAQCIVKSMQCSDTAKGEEK
ncbi:uroporphyrinogen-III synthase-like isoform X2 [Acropora palmata]|uniref:uroporphyrinogen-III synthase-like isoform X2 n=1 Tax=Acropora palmata TaxID=6131 RepID=UPI003DA0CBFD